MEKLDKRTGLILPTQAPLTGEVYLPVNAAGTRHTLVRFVDENPYNRGLSDHTDQQNNKKNDRV